MEPWRKRGFVPDSDEEEEFDTLDVQGIADGVVPDAEDEVDLEYLPIPIAHTLEPNKNAKEQPEGKPSPIQVDSEGARRGSVELLSTPATNSRQSKLEADTERSERTDGRGNTPDDKPRRDRKTYGRRSSAVKRHSHIEVQVPAPSLRKDAGVWEIPSSSPEQDGSASNQLRRQLSKSYTPSKHSLPLNAAQFTAQDGENRKKDNASRDSSPDELNVVDDTNVNLSSNDHRADDALDHASNDGETRNRASQLSDGLNKIDIEDSSRPANLAESPVMPGGKENVEEHADVAEDPYDDSPLSSPPDSLDFHLEDSAPRPAAGEPLNGIAQPETIEMDIPDEILREVTQPVRRSFRERNAIQLHPYALEMAQYQRQMRERGVKPIRMTEEEKKRRAAEASGESQEQDSFTPTGPGSSPPPEEFLRSSRCQEHPNGANELRSRQRTPIRRTYSSKRRKKSHIGDSQGLEALESVVPSKECPPPSGSLPSTEKPPFDPNVFRFPPGFTPPPTTNTEGNSRTTNTEVDVTHENDFADSATGSVAAEDRNEEETGDDGTDSEPSHISDEETVEEREIRLLQRRTRGVLPASWVRVHAQQSSADRQREIQRRKVAAAQRADGKGVAKKIIRKPGQPGGPGSGQRPILLDFSDSDDSDDANQQINDPVRDNMSDEGSRGKPRGPFGLPDPFSDDDENMEDNRIDNMFPVASSSGHRPEPSERRRALKRPTPKDSAMQKEKNTKRARFKRQTRITESAGVRRIKSSSKSSNPSSKSSSKHSSTRRPKSSTNSAPRLGILDAPDVAHRPRQEQPQFLRVAARRARSRQDSGRASPTRKFISLSTREDTADANKSLHEWRGGSIRQAKLDKPKRQPKRRQPPSNLANGIRRAVTNNKRTSEERNQLFAPEQDVIDVDMDQDVEQENAPAGGDVPPATAPSTHTVDARSRHIRRLERRGNEWIIHRNRGIISLKRTEPHSAPMHVAGLDNLSKPASVFSQSLNRLNRDYRMKQSSQGSKPSLTLDRFIADQRLRGSFSQTVPSSSAPALPANRNQLPAAPLQRPPRREKRKAVPRRIDQSAKDVAESSNHGLDLSPSDAPASFATPQTPGGPPRSSFGVGGLFNWQPSYSVDFGTLPLHSSTFFHESTFIGSGEFKRSLDITKRNMDCDGGTFTFHFKSQTFHWGSWNETVSSQLGTVFQEMCQDIEQNVICAPEASSAATLSPSQLIFRSVISYVTTTAWFIDPVDRKAFFNRAMKLAWRLQDSIRPFLAGDHNRSGVMMLSCYNMVFANQLRQVGSHELAGLAAADDAVDLVKASARDTLTLLMCDIGLLELHKLSVESRKKEGLAMGGIREQFPSAAAFVMVEQLLHSSDLYRGVFTEAELETCVNGLVQNPKDVVSLESAWRALFTVLPLNEFDQDGLVRRAQDSQFGNAHENWPLVKELLSPALNSFDTNSATTPMSYNNYCKTLFHRCHHLINAWGWRDCKPILDVLYDFFAARLLYNMKHEDVRGSPPFLDHLDQKPSLEVRPGEPCFHTVLKIIASGFHFLSLKYENKKIRNFAWRLLPNHGRVYPKEQPLNTQDLDALRNHHDLLCTLYWAVPDGCRPRVETIRDLVHPAASHRETCDINLRSWSRLVRFKLSTKEDVSGLDVFADWHSFFVTELRSQHAHARKEIESQAKDDKWISKHQIESTISKNQRQIESLLKTAISGLRTAVEQAPSLDHAYRLIVKTPFDSLLGMFSTKSPRVNAVVSDTLKVIVAYIDKDFIARTPDTQIAAAPPINEDSQEFDDIDDWNEIDAALGQQSLPSEAIEHVQKVLRPVVFQSVSNCFGEDNYPEDNILNDVLQCWTSVAKILIHHGLQRWDNYLDPFGDESWTRLRDTVQTRNFAPLFLAMCVGKDARVISDCRILVMGMWMSSLVERTSMLKYQHRLTEALLNSAPFDPLVQNLPFTKTKGEDSYEITLTELSQRRVSLISSILSNMRDHVQQMELHRSSELSVTKEDYSDILHQFMKAMQKNYRETGNGDPEAARGAYVQFVHQVIRFLQELTSDIRPVDPFFTDPALFPLPSSDPRYIVAKLKRYEPKLSAHKEVLALTMFIQSISERAAVDNQQSVLVEQLYKAVKDTIEDGVPNQPTLRAVLLQSVFPAYLECSFLNPASWILARPVVLTTTLVFGNLLFNINASNQACLSSVMIMIHAVFHSSYRALRPLSNRSLRLQDPIVISMLTVFVGLFSSSLTIIDYIDRINEQGEGLISYIQWFLEFVHAVSLQLGSSNLDTAYAHDAALCSPSADPLPRAVARLAPQYLASARQIALEDYQSYLRNWTLHQGKYYYSRAGHDAKEIQLESEVEVLAGDLNAAKKAFTDAVDKFRSQVGGLNLVP
ncbi:hypothetical protein N7468_007252 [Penicillium chermesinum]|uniref:Protein mms22 n=1 Tax=Penicillium chermesinum TaxID=63820 RepID=A0A9W9NTU3_9EURO|nr:uncharacterized protein N7468_007252 [Penicillium chermesinum]KAJ5226027.1 hypothetical protein N7468_007252 [Penicillium chermesinum]